MTARDNDCWGRWSSKIRHLEGGVWSCRYAPHYVCDAQKQLSKCLSVHRLPFHRVRCRGTLQSKGGNRRGKSPSHRRARLPPAKRQSWHPINWWRRYRMYKLSFCLPEADTASSNGLWHQTCPKLWHRWSLWCNGFSLNLDPHMQSKALVRCSGERWWQGEWGEEWLRGKAYRYHRNTRDSTPIQIGQGQLNINLPVDTPARLFSLLPSALFSTPPPYIYPVLTVCKVTVMALSGQSDVYITKLFSSFVTVSSQYIN